MHSEDNTAKNKEPSNTLEKAVESLVKIIANDKADQPTKKQINKRAAFWAGILTIVTTCATLITTTLLNLYDHKVERHFRQSEQVSQLITDANTQADKLSIAMTDLRSVRYLNQFECQKNNRKETLAEFKDRFIARVALVKINYGTKRAFNDDIYEGVKKFTAIDDQNKNLCAPDSPSDDSLM